MTEQEEVAAGCLMLLGVSVLSAIVGAVLALVLV